MKIIQSILFVGALLFVQMSHAERITVAAAADLKYAMDEIADAFKKANPSDELIISYGSSGTFYTQIQNGAPFDLFFSADINFPRELLTAGLAASEVRPYALGRIVIWSASMNATKMSLASLADNKISHVAIANPKHAPYGKRAEEALRAAGMWDKVNPKIVLGENVAQAAQFVWSGNAEVGIIALSLALNPGLADKGGYALIPDNMHQPLEQGYVITKRADKNLLAKRFADYMGSKPARVVMMKYGFVLPGEIAGK